MLLEGVVPVRVLAGQVEVGVVPGDPAGRSSQQAVVQDVPVVAGRVLLGGEVRADPELLQYDRLAERAGQLALPGGRVVLADLVVAHRVDVRAEEVADGGGIGEPESVVAAGRLDAPGPVAERERLAAAGRADRVPHDPGPRGHGLVRRVIAAVERHLVGDQPPGHGEVRAEPAHHLAGEPGLPPDHPHVAVQVPPRPPGRIPVLARHVPDDERGDRAHIQFGMLVEEVGEPRGHLLVDHVRLRHEVRPEEERPSHRQAMLAQHAQFLTDHGPVVAAPHVRPAGPGPEVGPEPAGRLPGNDDPGGVPAHGTPLPSPDGLRLPLSERSSVLSCVPVAALPGAYRC